MKLHDVAIVCSCNFLTMLNRAVVLYFLLLPAISYSQAQVVDSLELLVSNSTLPDTVKIPLLNQLVRKMRERDSKHVLTYALQAKALAEKWNNRRELCNALENLGWVNYRLGDYSKAYEVSIQAQQIAEEINDELLLARCLNNIAAVHYEQKQYPIAIAKFKEAYTISKRYSDYLTAARSLNNISFSFLGMRQLDSARIYGEQALSLGEQTNNPFMVGFALRTLGDIDVENNRTDAALLKFEEALAVAGDLKNTFLEISTAYRIGKLYFQRNKIELALPYLLRNAELSNEFGYKEELERSYKLLAEMYAARNDHARAFLYQNQYMAVHDSLYNQRKSEQMALMQARFDSELKEAEIVLLTKESELQEGQIRSQQLWTYFFAGSLMLLLLLAFVLLYNNRVKRKINLELETKNQKIQRQARQLRNMNSTKDKLFSIISHDMRSPLNSLRGLMDLIDTEGLTQEEFLQASKHLRKQLDSVHEDLDNLLYWAQSQLKGLQLEIQQVAVRAVVEEKVQLFKDQAAAKGVSIINDIHPDLVVNVDQNHLKLIFRNLIANGIKFNLKGGVIHIRQNVMGSKVEISVMDSGVGMSAKDLSRLFNVETHFTNPGTQQEKGTGLGLLLTKEFVEKNGGTIRAASEPGRGSTFTFVLETVPAQRLKKVEALSSSR